MDFPMATRSIHRLVLLALVGSVLFVIGIVACRCALASSPDMKSISWLPRSLARWADTEPTFRNFPAFAVLSFAATLFSFLLVRSVSAASAFHALIVVSAFSVVLEFSQFWLPGRCFDRLDIAWSVTGALSGAVAAFFLGLAWAGIVVRRG